MSFSEESEIENLNKIINHIEENLKINNKDDKDLLLISEISKAMNISISALNNLFNRGCPVTIHEYIVKRRMCLASHDLIETKENIINIAQKYGYSSDSFTKIFKKTYGLTPREYRKNGVLQKEFERFDIKIIDLDSLKLVEKHCFNCEFCMCGVCAGRSEEYGTPIKEIINKFPNGCEEFKYSLDAFIENEKKKERLIEELKQIAK